MDSRERIERCINGDSVDRTPVSLWRHFPVDDQSPYTLARSIVLFQNMYQFDFVKITPSSSFCIKDWGTRDVWKGNPEGTRDYVFHPIQHPEDWQKLAVISPLNGSLGEQLECIRLVRSALPYGTPVIQTIFSPLSQAKNLAGKDLLLKHLREYPDLVLPALKKIAETTLLFIQECKKLHIDGIFYAVQHAQKHLLSESEFIQFAQEDDLAILAEVQDLWLNVGHIHGSEIMFDLLAQYPVTVLNWHDREEKIPLEYGKSIFKGAVCGGLRQWDTMVYGSPKIVTEEAKDAIQSTLGTRFILGTGCVLPIIASHSNIMAAIEAVC